MSRDSARLTESVVALGSASPEAVRSHLRDIIASASMRTSKRSQEFLEYVVNQSLAGNYEQLKERAVGEHVFGRPPDYDTGQDSIVRVKANEVRRRLAQYYDLHPNAPLRIELPSGSYIAQVHEGHPVAAEQTDGPPSPRTTRWPIYAAAALVPVLALAVLLALRTPARATAFDVFWDRFFTANHELLMCIPTPETYRIYGRGREAVVEALRPRPPAEPRQVPAEDALRTTTIVAEPRLFVGLGDARALALIYSFASSRGKPPQMRLGSETTFAELRSAPAVLIGGMTNSWSVDLMKAGRFSFALQGSEPGIYDSKAGRFQCVKQQGWEPQRNSDCAVVTRLVNSKTGHPVLIAAGLHHYGTLAVGEFLTRPDLLNAALSSAPAGWQQRNLQLVFEIEVVRDDIGPPKMLAAHVW